MKSMFRQLLLAALTMLAFLAAAAQELQSPPLRNPFSRPDFMVATRTTPSAQSFLAAPVELELRATLVSNGRTLANVNGQVLAVGQSYEGHRLIYVEEGRAVLLRDGERLTLSVYERQSESDERR